MMIGIRAHDLVTGNIKDVLTQAEDYGFDAIQLVFKKALKQDFNEENALIVKEELKHHNIKIAMLGAYFNPVHSNSELVRKNVEYFKEHLRLASLLDCKYVGTETGSYNDDKWTYNPLNRTEEAFNENVRIFSDIARYAESVGANFALEGAFGHCMYKPSMLKKLADAINSPNLYFIVDIYNYLALENHDKHCQIFDECLELFKDRIVLFHIKDYVVGEDKLIQTCIGKGIMNFDYMLPIIKEKCPNAYLVFEGSKPEDMKFSFNFIKEKLGEK